MHDLLTIAPSGSGGKITSRGDLTVGGTSVAGPRAATVGASSGSASLDVKSTGGQALLSVQSGGANNADLTISAPSNQDAKLVLKEGANSFEIINDGDQDKLAIRDGTDDLMTIARATGALWTKGNVTVGSTSAAASASVKSTGAAATLEVQAGGTAQATVLIKSANNIDSKLALSHGSNTFYVQNAAASDVLAFTDGSNNLLTLARSTGAAVFKGDVTVGSTTGSRGLTIKSTTGAATATVQSGGSAEATVLVKSQSGVDAVMKLTTGSNSFEIANDASANKLAIREGSTDLFTVQKSTGNAFIKGTISTSSIGASIEGVAKSDTDGVVLTNRVNAADMDNTRVSLTFKQYYYHASSPAPVVMAKVTAGTETDWTSTSNTQDAYLALRVARDGALMERVRVTSSGNVGVGTTSPDMKLTVNGSASVQQDLTVGGGSTSGARVLSVVSTDNKVALNVISGASNASATVQANTGTAEVAVQASSAGQDAKVVLTQGSSSYTMLHRGSTDQFAVRDGSNDVLTIARSSGDATLRGSLTIGSGTGARSATVKANGANAAVEVISSTSGTASVTASAASGQNSKMVLKSGSTQMEVVNDGAMDQLKITNGTSDLITIARANGTLNVKGGLTVGVSTGAATATIKSTSGASSLQVVSSTSTATATISAANTKNAQLDLTQGNKTFSLMNQGSSDKFAVNDGTHDLLTVERVSGSTSTRGDVTVGGSTSNGAKSLTVQSSDDTATMTVQSGGGAGASVEVKASAGQDSSLTLTETGGKSWFVKNKGSNNALLVGEGSNTWLQIEQSGATTFKKRLAAEEGLTVGGDSISGAKEVLVQSPDDLSKMTVKGTSSSLSLTSTGANDASATITAQTGQKTSFTLKEDGGGAEFRMINDGPTDTLRINDGTSDLFTLKAVSGDATIKGGLNVKSGQLLVDASTGKVGVGVLSPQVQLHVNGSMKIENGDFTVGNGKLFVKHQTGFIGINNYAPSEALHIKGNVKIEPDANGAGGDLFATKGSIHFKYHNAAQGSVDREYYMATNAGVTLPTDTSNTCTSNCVPKASRLYMIRNKSGSSSITVTASVSVPVRKNGGTAANNVIERQRDGILCL
jgi:hypothetical protein